MAAIPFHHLPAHLAGDKPGPLTSADRSVQNFRSGVFADSGRTVQLYGRRPALHVSPGVPTKSWWLCRGGRRGSARHNADGVGYRLSGDARETFKVKSHRFSLLRLTCTVLT